MVTSLATSVKALGIRFSAALVLHRQFMVGTDEKTLAALHHPHKTLVLVQPRCQFSKFIRKIKHRIRRAVPSPSA